MKETGVDMEHSVAGGNRTTSYGLCGYLVSMLSHQDQDHFSWVAKYNTMNSYHGYRYYHLLQVLHLLMKLVYTTVVISVTTFFENVEILG